jgi:hypothetical protein
MAVVIEGERSIFMGARAHILTNDYETAWAEKYVVHNPAHAWIVGKFVEADRANNNGQYFTMEGLRMGSPTIAHSPMNMNHSPRRVVGAFVASDFMYPTGDESASNPYIEALGVFWKAHFPEDWAAVQEAHAEGSLFFSMECVPKQVGCIGDGSCGGVFEYAGVKSDTYCEHINNRTSSRDLIDPHFTAGAVLIPPVRPGWSDAEIHSLVAQHANLAESTYESISEEMDNLSKDQWESLMHLVLSQVASPKI